MFQVDVARALFAGESHQMVEIHLTKIIHESSWLTYCSKCGKELPEEAKFCPNCAAPISSQQSGQANQSLQPTGSVIPRPRGTRILMLADLIVGVLITVLGILALSSSYFGALVFIILGLLLAVVGYGLWKARPWAWLLGLWACVVYIVLGVLAYNVPFLLIGLVNVLFYYFTRAGLKRYLGKVQT